MTTMLELTCRDPIVARDGRPFGAGQGNRMRTLEWPLPSVVAGSLRSTLGKSAQREFSTATALELLQVEVAGVLPLAEGSLYLPAPADCIFQSTGKPLAVAPRVFETGGCDLPHVGLLPVDLPNGRAVESFKPVAGPAWWPAGAHARWLTNEEPEIDHRFLRAPEAELRTHVQIDPDAGAAADGHLFTTAALPLTHLGRYGVPASEARSSRFAAISLSGRVRANGWCADTAAALDMMHPLGGERRMVRWKATTGDHGWSCPPAVREALSSARRVRMVLATPALFAGGWKPGWLDQDLLGTPPGADVVLRLVGVTSQRWRAVSGWSMASLPGQPRGPKPVKRMVPAGGVYFFEVAGGRPESLTGRWLEPVSDDGQDRRDGFGLALWGIW